MGSYHLTTSSNQRNPFTMKFFVAAAPAPEAEAWGTGLAAGLAVAPAATIVSAQLSPLLLLMLQSLLPPQLLLPQLLPLPQLLVLDMVLMVLVLLLPQLSVSAMVLVLDMVLEPPSGKLVQSLY